jgi:hypothetical protein
VLVAELLRELGLGDAGLVRRPGERDVLAGRQLALEVVLPWRLAVLRPAELRLEPDRLVADAVGGLDAVALSTRHLLAANGSAVPPTLPHSGRAVNGRFAVTNSR